MGYFRTFGATAFVGSVWLATAFIALSGGCGQGAEKGFQPSDGSIGDGSNGSQEPPIGTFDGGDEACLQQCSPDFRNVVDCNGAVLKKCEGTDGCDPQTFTCTNACTSASKNKQSVGCEYYATFMDQTEVDACFAAFVANTWQTNAHLKVDYKGQTVLGNGATGARQFAWISSGDAKNWTTPYDPAVGLKPGEVAVLFLAGPSGEGPKCPKDSAVPSGAMVFNDTGIADSFHIEADVPVVAYQINPYGGGPAQTTGASLLIPTSAWDTNYIGINAYKVDIALPSMNIVAMTDDTTVSMLPIADVRGGPLNGGGAGTLPAGLQNGAYTFKLNKGQHAQFSQRDELTGSVIQSDKAIGLMAGHNCLRVPVGVSWCDHAEQMVPPVRAMGHQYVGVGHKQRANEKGIWRIIGAVDGTTLTWSSDVGGPNTISRGQVVEFQTTSKFVVSSQDKEHPFLLFDYMSGNHWTQALDGIGDADFVLMVPPDQFMNRYVFFADPTYPETHLVVVRTKQNGKFEEVNLDCAGAIVDWTPIGEYEYAYVQVTQGEFDNVGLCSAGRREITSKAPFGLWVWGWGTPATGTRDVSYGYPGGMNVQPINTVVIDVPK